MALRVDGHAAAGPAALSAPPATATPRVLVLLHGLCMNDTGGSATGTTWADPGARGRLRRLHYNTGLHIADNGQQLAALQRLIIGSGPCHSAPRARPQHGRPRGAQLDVAPPIADPALAATRERPRLPGRTPTSPARTPGPRRGPRAQCDALRSPFFARLGTCAAPASPTCATAAHPPRQRPMAPTLPCPCPAACVTAPRRPPGPRDRRPQSRLPRRRPRAREQRPWPTP